MADEVTAEQLLLDELPGGSDTCPYVDPDSGQVCGERLILWEKVEYRHYLYWNEAKNGYVSGPGSYEGGSGADDEVMCTNLHSWAVPDFVDYE